MARMGMIHLGMAAAAWLALLATPATAMNMTIRNAKAGCGSLVKAAHPDLKGKERGAEIKKCKDDPEGYNKSSGL
jgi:hypothetical protein